MQAVELTTDDVPELIQVWTALSNNRVEKRLGLALRRFRQACLRPQVEDQLVDNMIAAESLFLKGNLQELAYKVAVRCAGFVVLADNPPSSVFVFMKKAYDLRSRVVHGERPTNMQRLGGGSASNMHEVVADLESILREALLNAVTMVANGKAIDNWDEDLAAILDRGHPSLPA